jgi:hypothetical protein
MQLAQTADGIMDGRDELPGRFASQRLYVEHLTTGANGIVERFHRTVLNEFYRVAFRRKIYSGLEQLQADLDSWLKQYNRDSYYPTWLCH